MREVAERKRSRREFRSKEGHPLSQLTLTAPPEGEPRLASPSGRCGSRKADGEGALSVTVFVRASSPRGGEPRVLR